MPNSNEQDTPQQSAMDGLTRQFGEAFSAEETIAETLRGVIEAMGSDVAFFCFNHGHRLVLQDVAPSLARKRIETGSEHFSGQCLCDLAVKTGRPFYCTDILTDEHFSCHECKERGFVSFAALPIINRGTTIGVIGLASEAERDFAAQARFLQVLAHCVAMALANAFFSDGVQQKFTERHKSHAAQKRFMETLENTSDLSRRKWAEDQLWQSEERFRLTFAASPDAINISRLADGVFVDVNERFTHLTGFTREDVIGKPSLSINMWHDAADRERLVHCLKEKGFCNDLEARFRRKDGSVGTGLISARIIKLQGVAHLISVTRDITDVKKAEAEKEKLQAHLIQAQKMQAVGQLAGGVAHDFNNMLSVVIGHTEMALLNPDLNGDLQKRLKAIHQASLRSSDLVSQLLVFASKQTTDPRVLDINDTIDGTLGMLGRLIGEDIDLAWVPGRNPGRIKIDRSQMDQVLTNLVVNGRDAIADVGKITIETDEVVIDEAYCAAYPCAKPGAHVLLAVSDNGCGMHPETLAQVFEPFFTTKSVGHGTGLGLATVYGIIKQNDGFINVYSEPGHGTTFRIYLPAVDGVLDDDSAGMKKEASLEGCETVLVVEDDQDTLEIIRSILETLGYRVLSASAPKDAIAIATRQGGAIDLLISDVVMPEMNGRQLAHRIGEIVPGLKSLFISGYSSNVIAHHGVLDPGVHFVQKPFSINDLAVKVKEALFSS